MNVCVVCKTDIYLGGAFRGMGDGTGQQFAHEECYWKHHYSALRRLAEAVVEMGLSPIQLSVARMNLRAHLESTKESTP